MKKNCDSGPTHGKHGRHYNPSRAFSCVLISSLDEIHRVKGAVNKCVVFLFEETVIVWMNKFDELLSLMMRPIRDLAKNMSLAILFCSAMLGDGPGSRQCSCRLACC